MSNSITDMQSFFMGLHENDQMFSCKNTDQLSSLWAAFTKCKRNIRDGFRLENMSWRLWSRQAIMMRKRLESETAIVLPELTTAAAANTTSQQKSSSSITLDDYTKDTDTNDNEYTAPRLVRTRSLPSLSCQAQHIIDSCQVSPTPSPTTTTSSLLLPATTDLLHNDNDTTKECSAPLVTLSSLPPPPKQSKFYIHQGDDDDDNNDDADSLDNIEESDVESMYNHDDSDYFDDMESSCYSSDSTACSSPSSLDGGDNNKPVSLLTHLLQKDNTPPSELRRSNCYERLDLWFNGALSS